jgi:hypothetical protein
MKRKAFANRFKKSYLQIYWCSKAFTEQLGLPIQIFKNKSETDKLGSLDKFNCTEGFKSRIFNVHVALQTEIESMSGIL